MSEYFDEEGKPNLFGSGFASCPQPGYEELRTRCPVARTSVLDQVVIARHEDVVRALRQPLVRPSSPPSRAEAPQATFQGKGVDVGIYPTYGCGN